MASMELLPAEILSQVFQTLDRPGQLYVSHVCGYWREVVHSMATQGLAARIRLEQHLPDQLRRSGWLEEEHTAGATSCSCIQIYLNFWPLRTGASVGVCQSGVSPLETVHTTVAVSRDQLYVASTTLGDGGATQVRAVSRSGGDGTESRLVTSLDCMTDIHLYCHDNTLVMLERRTQQENILTSVISVHNFHLSLWEATTHQKVAEIDFLSHLTHLPTQGMHTEISDVAITNGQLALHVFSTKLDWLQPEELPPDYQAARNTSLFWSLDTGQPGQHGVTFLTALEKSLVEGNICDTGFIFLNHRFFLRYLSGLFSYHSRPKFATKVQVFEAQNLNSLEPWVVDVNQTEVADFGDCNDDSIKLEPGSSSRLAVFNAYSSSFKIIDIVSSANLLSVDMRGEACLGPLFSIWQLHEASWVGGHFTFLKEVPQLDSSDKLLRVVIVTEEENPAGTHVPKLPHFLLGREIRCEQSCQLSPATRATVDLTGVTLVTEDLILTASFNL